MIIEIDKSVIENLELIDDNEIEALINLASSRARGFNFILGNKTHLLKLSQFSEFSRTTRSTFNKAATDQIKWSNLLKNFNFRVRLIKNNVDIFETEEDGVNILNISLSKFLFYKIDYKPSLIAENLTDISFYTHVVRSYLKSKNVVSLELSFTPVNGGGSTTKDVVIEHFKQQNGISICLLDSDLKIPWGEYGETANDVISVLPNQPYAKTMILKSREAENIIPTKILEQLSKNNKVFKLKVEKFKSLSSIVIDNERPIRYVDFKKGIKKYMLNTSCPKTNKFWQDSFEESNLLKICKTQRSCTTSNNCKCLLADGLGTDLLKSTVEFLENNDFHYSDVDDYMKNEWDFICGKISPYVIAPKRFLT
ncbi:hypothetical protein [Photobacterium leiognathi]|uniref:hypothetical protein n=1 Tax=Photobacterium leiognathi TaxID=553611 RepID=UPI0029819B81|nr:hypothetical protein [Photobacterium leiognathi]